MRKPQWFRGEWRPSRGPSSTHGVPRKYIEGSLKIFLRQTLGQRPRVCLRKIFWEPSIYSHGTPLSSLVNLPRGSIHHDTTSAYSQIVPIYYQTGVQSIRKLSTVLRVFACLVLTTVAYYMHPWYGQSFPRGQFYLPTPAAFTLFIP